MDKCSEKHYLKYVAQKYEQSSLIFFITTGKIQLEPAFKKGINIKNTEVTHDTNGQYDWTSAKNLVTMHFWTCALFLSLSIDQAPPLLWIRYWETQLQITLGFMSKNFTGKNTTFLSSSISKFLGKDSDWPNMGWVPILDNQLGSRNQVMFHWKPFLYIIIRWLRWGRGVVPEKWRHWANKTIYPVIA